MAVMSAAAIATIVIDGCDIPVHDARLPASRRDVLALVRGGGVGVVVASDDAETFERVVRAGAVAIFPAPPDTREMTQAARDVSREGCHVHPDLVPTLLGLTRRALRHDCALTALTAREREVLRLLERGLSNRAISQRLFLSEHTVRNHLARIYRKLDVTTRAQAVEAIAEAFGDAAPNDDDERHGPSD